jgi:hypothetical protein
MKGGVCQRLVKLYCQFFLVLAIVHVPCLPCLPARCLPAWYVHMQQSTARLLACRSLPV